MSQHATFMPGRPLHFIAFLFILAVTSQSWQSRAQTLQMVGGNVGVGTSTPTEKLEVNGNQKLSGYLKFNNTSADVNDGKIAAATFLPGLNFVGINSDNTIRKIALWGQVTQSENAGTNLWRGFTTFAGSVSVEGGLTALQRVEIKSGSTGNSVMGNSAEFLGSAEIAGNGTGAAMLAFHRPGSFAAYLGLDTDNRFKVGGWSMGSAAFPLLLMNTWNGGVYIHDDGRIYGNIFIDNGDHGYYLNANAVSRLSEIAANVYSGPHAGADSGMVGDRRYQWGYQEGGAWAHPFPDLIIGYHTGMKLGAHYQMGGLKFYADHPSISSDLLFSIGNGDRNVKVTANLVVNTSNVTGGGLVLSDDGDIVDMNDGFATMRFNAGVRVNSTGFGGQPVITLGTNGKVTAATFQSSSSGRWKVGVAQLQHALAALRQLNGVSYQWGAGSALAGQNDIGFIAEEMDRVIPELVGKDPEGKPAGIDYGKVSAVVVEAVKELDGTQVAMASLVDQLQGEVARLRERDEKRSAREHYLAIVGSLLALAVGAAGWIRHSRAS